MAQSVKAAVLVEPRRIEIEVFPLPDVGADEALIRVEIAGVCGTDAKLYAGAASTKIYPLILGHEILGRVVTAGPGFAARHHVADGDRLVIESSIPCGECAFCERGAPRFCKRGRNYGVRVSSDTPPHLWGAFSEYMYLAPNSIVHRIADSVPPRAAVVAAACLANGIRWMRTAGDVGISKSAVIQGVGPQGLAAVIAAKESGAYPIVVTGLARDQSRLELARELGADVCVNVETDDLLETVREVTGGELADTVLDVTGSPAAIEASVYLVKPMGTLVCAGTPAGNRPSTINTTHITHSEIRFQGVYTHTSESIKQAIRLAERGRYPLEKLISHEFPLDQADVAIRAVAREIEETNPIKAAIAP
jgi:alcohol dehydrogenase